MDLSLLITYWPNYDKCYIILIFQKSLEEAKSKKETEMSDLESKMEEIKLQMSELKANLYGKFGSHINLENEEE